MIEIKINLILEEKRAELIVGGKKFDIENESLGVHRLKRPDDVPKTMMLDSTTLGSIIASETFSHVVDILQGLQDVGSQPIKSNEDLWREDIDEYDLDEFHGKVF